MSIPVTIYDNITINLIDLQLMFEMEPTQYFKFLHVLYVRH